MDKIKTLASVITENNQYTGIINAVHTIFGNYGIHGVLKHGILDYGTFTGYFETHEFALKHQDIILLMLDIESEVIDIPQLKMVKTFHYFKDIELSEVEMDDIKLYLNGGKPIFDEDGDKINITTPITFFSIEKICEMFITYDEDFDTDSIEIL